MAKFRRKTAEEVGLADRSNVKERDNKALVNLQLGWPRVAEKTMRDGNGKNRISTVYSGREQGKNRKDFFDPKYPQRCTFPVKDTYGEYTERCPFMVHQEYEAARKDKKNKWARLYNNPRNRTGIFEKCSLIQFIVMKHCEEHFRWYVDEMGFDEEQPNGEIIHRPPKSTEINPLLLEWEEEDIEDGDDIPEDEERVPQTTGGVTE